MSSTRLLFSIAALWCLAAGLLLRSPSIVNADAAPAKSQSRAVADAPAVVASDDGLPKGAVLRLGTDRFRQEGEVQQLQYSSDGKNIASISRDAIVIWGSRSGRQVARLQARQDDKYVQRFSAIAYSPDGEEIAAVGGARIHVWELETGRELLSFPVQSGFRGRGELAIRYSPNGERLAVSAGMTVLLFDTATGRQVQELTIENHRAAFQGLCWTPDGAHILTATLDPAVVAWNAESGELVKRFEVEKGQAFSTSPSMSPDGKTVLAATGGVVHFWRFADGGHLKNIELDADYINTLILTPDDKTLIVGSQDGIIRIADAQAGKPVRRIDGRLWIGRSLAVSPDFKTVALGAVYPTIRQWNIETGDEAFPELTSTGHDAEVKCVACSPDGRLIASGGANRQINLWDPDNGTLRLKLPTQSSANRIAFTPSGRHLLTSWQSAGTVSIWDVATGRELRTIESGMKRVRAFLLTRDAKRLISVVSNSQYEWHSPVGEETFQVLDFESGEKLHEFTFQTASTESAALTGDGQALVTGAANGIIHVLEIESGKELAVLPGHQHSVGALAFSSDGALLASGSMDQTIRIWDAKKWKSLRVLKGHQRAVTSVAFAPQGRVLASGSGTASYPLAPENSQMIRIWDAGSGEQIGAFSGHDANTAALAFAPNGQRLVSAHDNTTLLVWDVSPFRER